MDYQLGPGPLQVDQNTIDEKIKGDIGIVENGDIATHAILKDYYVIWKGNLYKAKTDISSGTTLSAESNGNLDPKSNGLGGEVAALNSNYAFYPTANSEVVDDATINGIRYGKVCKMTYYIRFKTAGSGWTNVATIPAGYLPTIQQYGICAVDASISAGEGKIAETRVLTDGRFMIFSPVAGVYIGEIVYICS